MDDLNITRELEEIKHALWDLQPTGNAKSASPVYVRGLRDRAAVEIMGREGYEVRGAVQEANDLVRALGYEPPEEG